LARRRTLYSRQRALEQELKKGLADLKSTRSTLKEAEERAMEGFYLKPKAFAKISDADYRRMARLEKRLGIYEPTGKVLTPSRKRAIRAHWVELENLSKDAVFAEYPAGASPKRKKEIARDLRRAYPKVTEDVYGQPTTRAKGGKATKRGIFLPKSERQISAPVGRLQFDRDTGVWAVQVRKKNKEGLYVAEMRYIAGSDVLDKKRDKLQRRFEKTGKLRRNQRLRFIIGKNESRRTFRNMQELFKYAARYRRDDQARATFLNELIIEVVEKGEPRFKHVGKGKRARTVKDPWTKRSSAFRASNYHEVDPDIIADMTDYEDDEE
jgi:hypothetical protein